MTTTESAPKSSPFLSLFHRKKKINGTKSTDDIKNVTALSDAYAEMPLKDKKNKQKKSESHTLPTEKEKKKNKKNWDRSVSLDVLCEESPAMLLEALETIAADQPIVARSIPKHARVIKREDKSMKNCLFEREVYDSMLSDSLRVCDLLQTHLDDCIVSVRAKSPETCLDTSQDGRDSGRGASSASSTISTSPATLRKQQRMLKSCVPADV